jgi:UDP-glucose:(heptosyl)LPS alpha-1,3-glucosyltransferase
MLTSPRLWTYLALEAARMKPRPGRIVIAVSETLRRDLAAAYGCFQPLIEVVPPGVAPPALIDDRMATRQALGLADEARILVFVACDHQKKGMAALLDALAVLPATVVLVVVGNSSSIPGFERQAAVLGVAARVRFTGMLPDPGSMYRAAEMLVHPTLEDTFGMVVLEAMAYGLPVVVSNGRYCGIAANFTHAHDALLLTDPRDGRAIAAAVSRLLNDSGLRAQLAAAGRKRAQCSDWASVAAQYQQIYRQATDSTLPTGADEQYDVASRVTTSRT